MCCIRRAVNCNGLDRLLGTSESGPQNMYFGNREKPGIGRPQKRWLDDVKRHPGRYWFQLAQDTRHKPWKGEDIYVY